MNYLTGTTSWGSGSGCSGMVGVTGWESVSLICTYVLLTSKSCSYSSAS